MDGDPDYLGIDIARDRLAGWRFASASDAPASPKEAAHA